MRKVLYTVPEDVYWLVGKYSAMDGIGKSEFISNLVRNRHKDRPGFIYNDIDKRIMLQGNNVGDPSLYLIDIDSFISNYEDTTNNSWDSTGFMKSLVGIIFRGKNSEGMIYFGYNKVYDSEGSIYHEFSYSISKNDFE